MRLTRLAIAAWVKVNCLHREEFVVVGWTDPERSRPWLGAGRLWHRLQPLATSKMPLDVPPPGTSRFGSSARYRCERLRKRPERIAPTTSAPAAARPTKANPITNSSPARPRIPIISISAAMPTGPSLVIRMRIV
jgi:hypothetical protein